MLRNWGRKKKEGRGDWGSLGTMGEKVRGREWEGVREGGRETF